MAFAFDDAGADAVAAGGADRLSISAIASAVALVRREGGKGRLGGGLAADDVEGAGSARWSGYQDFTEDLAKACGAIPELG